MNNMKIISGTFIATLFLIPTLLLKGYDDTFVIYTYMGLLFVSLVPFFSIISRKQYKFAIFVFLLTFISVAFLVVCIMSQPSSLI